MIFCEYSKPSYYSDVIMTAMASQTTRVSIVCSTVCSSADQASKPRVASLYNGKSTGDCWFPSQRASNAENVSIWWRHHLKVMTMVGILSTLLSILINYILIMPDDANLCYGLAYHTVILRTVKEQCSSNIFQNLNCQNTLVRRL